MSMDTPDNYYATLGVPVDVESDTLKRAYRQLARRYHPDLAGPEGDVQMKRINRAYDVLSDHEKRLQYDTIIGGVIDMRAGGLVRSRARVRKFDLDDDIEYAGLSIFSTRGPLHTGPRLRSSLGVISALASASTPPSLLVAAGSLDGKGLIWDIGSDTQQVCAQFAADPALTLESLRELRFSAAAGLLAGWGRLGLHLWEARQGTLLWSQQLAQRAVSAHYSLDVVLQETAQQRAIIIALPMLPPDLYAPRQRGVRATDVLRYGVGQTTAVPDAPIVCPEEDLKARQFWAIRLRALSHNASTLLTLSCAHVPGDEQEMAIVRRWDLTARARFGGKIAPRIISSVVAGLCADCAPPYAVTSDVGALAYVQGGSKLRLYDTARGTFTELPCGSMGGSARLAISHGAEWLAVAREDSEVNEGVIDLWSPGEGRIIQKLYHPWQISALHFAGKRLVVALTDGAIQVWQ